MQDKAFDLIRNRRVIERQEDRHALGDHAPIKPEMAKFVHKQPHARQSCSMETRRNRNRASRGLPLLAGASIKPAEHNGENTFLETILDFF